MSQSGKPAAAAMVAAPLQKLWLELCCLVYDVLCAEDEEFYV